MLYSLLAKRNEYLQGDLQDNITTALYNIGTTKSQHGCTIYDLQIKNIRFYGTCIFVASYLFVKTVGLRTCLQDLQHLRFRMFLLSGEVVYLPKKKYCSIKKCHTSL